VRGASTEVAKIAGCQSAVSKRLGILGIPSFPFISGYVPKEDVTQGRGDNSVFEISDLSIITVDYYAEGSLMVVYSADPQRPA
jgi:hypothetical protein